MEGNSEVEERLFSKGSTWTSGVWCVRELKSKKASGTKVRISHDILPRWTGVSETSLLSMRKHLYVVVFYRLLFMQVEMYINTITNSLLMSA